MKQQNNHTRHETHPGKGSWRPNLLARTLTATLTMAIIAAAFRTALSQTAPILTATRTGTNALLITVTNSTGAVNFDLYTAPLLVGYPWTAAVIGTNFQTNFTVSMGPYLSGFYMVEVDTNGTVPPWKAADPNNPGAGILAVFIDSPTNGTVLQ